MRKLLLLAGLCLLQLAGASATPKALHERSSFLERRPGPWTRLQQPIAPVSSPDADPRALLNRYCVTCHNEKLKTAGLMLYGSAISDSNVHMHDNLPLVLVGGGAGQIKGGRHIRYPKDTPVTNLFLNMLDKLGVPADHIGDSTGRLELLEGV